MKKYLKIYVKFCLLHQDKYFQFSLRILFLKIDTFRTLPRLWVEIKKHIMAQNYTFRKFIF